MMGNPKVVMGKERDLGKVKVMVTLMVKVMD